MDADILHGKVLVVKHAHEAGCPREEARSFGARIQGHAMVLKNCINYRKSKISLDRRIIMRTWTIHGRLSME
jgi:hypothetical protein